MNTSKDSPELIKFMALFKKLRDWIDDDPDGLIELAADDEVLKKLCVELCLAAVVLSITEKRERKLFSAPVDPKYVVAWREYETRYSSSLSDILHSGSDLALGSAEGSKQSKADFLWDFADSEAKNQAAAIETAIEFANEEATDEYRAFPDGYRESIEEGALEWHQLIYDVGFDIRGVIRRRALVPFVLVPRHVSSHYGEAEKFSLLKNLQQAHDAFIFGAPYAALALMRSIMEVVLRDHYLAKGEDLNQRIRNARNRLPRGASEAALHRLRKVANAILHLDREKDEGLPKLDEMRLEKEIVSLLFVLRALIEGVQ